MTIKINDRVQVVNPERKEYGLRGRIVTISHGEEEPYRVKLLGVDQRIDFKEDELEVVLASETSAAGGAVRKFADAFRATKPVMEDRPAELKKIRTSDPILLARKLVQSQFYPEVPLDEIYVVWFCSALKNWKALVSTNVKDNMYYELTHDGNKEQTYIDQYVKSKQATVTDEYAETALGI